MSSIVFEFKTKVNDLGEFKRPDLDVKHVVGLMSEAQLRVACRKKKNAGIKFPPKEMNINNLPKCV